jgi:predicted PurR-regulated permease PerM
MSPPPSPTAARNALVIIAVVVAGAALHWLGGIVTPLLLAIFVAIMVDGLTRLIHRRAPMLPPAAAIAAAIAIAVVALGGTTFIIAGNAGAFIGRLADYEPKLDTLIATLGPRLGVRAPHTLDQILAQFDPAPYLGTVAEALQGFGSAAVLVLIYVAFLIASRHAFDRKMVRLFTAREERQEAMMVFFRVRDSIERYLWVQTVSGAIIATVGFALMAAVGLENSFFWAFLIFVLNYIPIVGAVVAILLPSLFALVQFSGAEQAAGILLGLFTVTFLVGNILLPRMQGRSLNLDPLVVMMSLGFWGAILGLPGMFLSTPLTVLAMIILAQFERSRWIAIILSGDGDPLGMTLPGAGAPGEGNAT